MNEFDKLRKQAERYRALYPKGTRIELTHMGSDPRPIPDGTRGTVEAVDDIHVNRKSCPDEVEAMLKTAVEPEKTNEVKFE